MAASVMRWRVSSVIVLVECSIKFTAAGDAVKRVAGVQLGSASAATTRRPASARRAG
jgi:hypothetical protein